MLTQPVISQRVPNSLGDYQTSQFVREVDRRVHYTLIISVAGEPLDRELIDLHMGRGDVGSGRAAPEPRDRKMIESGLFRQ